MDLWLWLSIKEGLVCNKLIADIMVVLHELYMSSMFVSSTCSIDSSGVGADGCWSRKHSNCHVLAGSFFLWWIHKFYGRQICRVVNISPSPTKLSVYIPECYQQFQYDISYIARSYFSSSLVFDMYEMPIMLNVDNSISGSPF